MLDEEGVPSFSLPSLCVLHILKIYQRWYVKSHKGVQICSYQNANQGTEHQLMLMTKSTEEEKKGSNMYHIHAGWNIVFPLPAIDCCPWHFFSFPFCLFRSFPCWRHLLLFLCLLSIFAITNVKKKRGGEEEPNVCFSFWNQKGKTSDLVPLRYTRVYTPV